MTEQLEHALDDVATLVIEMLQRWASGVEPASEIETRIHRILSERDIRRDKIAQFGQRAAETLKSKRTDANRGPSPDNSLGELVHIIISETEGPARGPRSGLDNPRLVQATYRPLDFETVAAMALSYKRAVALRLMGDIPIRSLDEINNFMFDEHGRVVRFELTREVFPRSGTIANYMAVPVASDWWQNRDYWYGRINAHHLGPVLNPTITGVYPVPVTSDNWMIEQGSTIAIEGFGFGGTTANLKVIFSKKTTSGYADLGPTSPSLVTPSGNYIEVQLPQAMTVGGYRLAVVRSGYTQSNWENFAVSPQPPKIDTNPAYTSKPGKTLTILGENFDFFFLTWVVLTDPTTNTSYFLQPTEATATSVTVILPPRTPIKTCEVRVWSGFWTAVVGSNVCNVDVKPYYFQFKGTSLRWSTFGSNDDKAYGKGGHYIGQGTDDGFGGSTGFFSQGAADGSALLIDSTWLNVFAFFTAIADGQGYAAATQNYHLTTYQGVQLQSDGEIMIVDPYGNPQYISREFVYNVRAYLIDPGGSGSGDVTEWKKYVDAASEVGSAIATAFGQGTAATVIQAGSKILDKLIDMFSSDEAVPARMQKILDESPTVDWQALQDDGAYPTGYTDLAVYAFMGPLTIIDEYSGTEDQYNPYYHIRVDMRLQKFD